MTYSKIALFFQGDLSPSNHIGFTYRDPVLRVTNVVFTWVTTRFQSNQVEQGTPTLITGERSAINFMDAFNADYNAGGTLFEVTRTGSTVEIASKRPSIEFLNPFAQVSPTDNTPLDPQTDPVAVIFTITADNTPVFDIENVVFSEATTNSPCTHFKISVETSEITDRTTGDYTLQTGNTDNPFEFEMLREQALEVFLYGQSNQENSLRYNATQVPSLLNESKFEFIVTNSPNGATLVINDLGTNNLNLEYSLNNTDWQTDNDFYGLLVGNHTIYVRDHLGCSFTKSITITDTSVRVPYFHMPKSNPIRYANRVNWGDCANYKNDENTLCHETEDVEEPKGYCQDWQSCDVVTTQFQTNYNIRVAKVIKEDGSEVLIPVNKMTSNMGLKDSRDARKYNLGSGKTGVYFTTGNLYDYDTSNDTGNDYILNGNLPDWAYVGNYVKVDNAWFLIEEIRTSEEKNAQVIVITNNYTGADVAVITSSVYDLENFEEYEYTIDMVDFLNDTFQVQLVCTDPDFTTITYLSEQQNCKIKQVGSFEIKYRNSTNTDVNFSRGLEYVVRFMVEKVGDVSDDETEANKTDTSAYLSESEIHEVDEFTFSPLPKQMMHLLRLALSHDTVSIRGMRYVKSENLQIEGPLEKTNLYDVVARMIKTNSAFNSNVVQGSAEVNSSDIEIPGLLEHDAGYLKY